MALLEEMPWPTIAAASTAVTGTGATKGMKVVAWTVLALLEKMPGPMRIDQGGAIWALLEEMPWLMITAVLIAKSVLVSLEATRRTTLLQACRAVGVICTGNRAFEHKADPG